ncbi:MAG TPA: hypothetical protein VFR70_08545 [Flavobacterium sp.]|nr:hypothetical protein [Flavobacterium sp.]
MEKASVLKRVLQASCLFLALTAAAPAQVGIGTTSPAAALDITSANDGLLVPRIALKGIDDIAAIETPAASELIYNTNTAGLGATAVAPGFYYLNPTATAWIRLAIDGQAWNLAGNAGTDPAASFLGTTDNKGFAIKTANAERMRITPAGNIGIGTSSPAERLSVAGNAAVSGNLETGSVRLFNPLGGPNSKRADIILTANSVDYRILNDAATEGSVYMSAKRSEGTAGIVAFPNPNTSVGIGTSTPGGKLEIVSSNNGMLIPRVPLTSLNTVAPVITPTASELVYNTNTGGSGDTAVTPGYYYLNPAANGWIRLATGTEATPDWKLGGNTGTNPSVNFLGTIDGRDFAVRTNNIERIRAASSGNIGIGTNSPAVRLDVNGDASVGDKLYLQNASGRSAPVLSADNIKSYSSTNVRIYDDNSNSHLSIESFGSAEIQAYSTTGAAGNALEVAGTESNLLLNPRGGNVGIGTAAAAERLEVNNGNIFLNSNAGQSIRWTDAGSAPPSFTARSAGTKLVLAPAVAVGRTDFAIGIEGNAIWQAVPQNNATFSHKFYGGTAPLMTIRGDGNVGINTVVPSATLEINGSIKVKTAIVPTANSSYAITATDNYIIANAANIAVILPDPATNQGRILYISRNPQNGTGSTVNGPIYSDASGFSTSLLLGAGLRTLACDGTYWYTN